MRFAPAHPAAVGPRFQRLLRQEEEEKGEEERGKSVKAMQARTGQKLLWVLAPLLEMLASDESLVQTQEPSCLNSHPHDLPYISSHS